MGEKTTTIIVSGDSPTKQEPNDKKRLLKALEAKAVAEATATADASFTPSPSLLNASTASALMAQVDGPSLRKYEGKESVYVGRSVPVGAGSSLTVPIQVTTPGSVVEYAVETKQYDIGFGITAEREEGITIVKETTRCFGDKSSDSSTSSSPLTGKFLVGSVPCLINFFYDNEYSWMREKLVSYKVTVTPPSKESLIAGRRRRAQACRKSVDQDLTSGKERLDATKTSKAMLEQEIEQLTKQLAEKKKSLAVVETEETWLQERIALRTEQKQLLTNRLEKGWEDEQGGEDEDANENGGTTKSNGK